MNNKFKILPLNILTYTLIFLSLYYLTIDFSIKNIGHTITLLFVWLLVEYIFSKLLKLSYSFNSAIITSLLWVLILFKWFWDDIYISNIFVIISSIIAKKLLQKYFVTRVNPIVLGICIVIILSYLNILNVPIVWWQWASSNFLWFNIVLPIVLIIWWYLAFKFKKIFIIISFISVYFTLFIINNWLNNIYDLIFGSTIYFYLLFMLIEPKSSPLWSTKQIIFWSFSAITLSLFIENWYMAPYILSILFANILNFWLNKISNEENSDVRYLCVPCWYIYDEDLWDPDSWIAPWTKFEDIPDDWKCPICWVTKDDFIKIGSHDNIDYIDASVISKKYVNVAKNVIELKLNINIKQDYKIWQYISLVYNDKDWEFRRNYSIVNMEKNIYTFLIKINSQSRSSQVLMNLTIWNIIRIAWIYGQFVLNKNKNKKIFIATWTWLAPIINMIKNSKTENILFLWLRHKADLFYIKILQNIPLLKIYIYLSNEDILPTDIRNIIYKKGRIKINNYLKENNYENNTDFYICWNEWLINESTKILLKKWIKNVHFEKF